MTSRVMTSPGRVRGHGGGLTDDVHMHGGRVVEVVRVTSHHGEGEVLLRVLCQRRSRPHQPDDARLTVNVELPDTETERGTVNVELPDTETESGGRLMLNCQTQRQRAGDG